MKLLFVKSCKPSAIQCTEIHKFQFSGFVLNCAVFGSLFRPLKPIRVQAPPNSTKEPAELPLLLRIKLARDMNASATSLGGNNNMRSSAASLNQKRHSAVSHDDEKTRRTRTTSESSNRSTQQPAAFRPLYRDDAFFGASLTRLSQYTSQVKFRQDQKYMTLYFRIFLPCTMLK